MSVFWLNPKIAQIISDHDIKPTIPRTGRINPKTIFNQLPKDEFGPVFRDSGYICRLNSQDWAQETEDKSFLPPRLTLSPYDLGYQAATNTDSVIDLISPKTNEPFLPRIISHPEPTVGHPPTHSASKTCSTQTHREPKRITKKKSKNIVLKVEPFDAQGCPPPSSGGRGVDLATWQLEAARAVRDLYFPERERSDRLAPRNGGENRGFRDEVVTFPHWGNKKGEDKATEAICREMMDKSFETERPNLITTASSTADFLQTQTRSCSPIRGHIPVDQSFDTREDGMQTSMNRSTSPMAAPPKETGGLWESREVVIQAEVPPAARDELIATLVEPPKAEKATEDRILDEVEDKMEDPGESVGSSDLNSVIDSLMDCMGDKTHSTIRAEPRRSEKPRFEPKKDSIQEWMRNSFRARNEKYLEERKMLVTNERKPYAAPKLASDAKRAAVKRRKFSEVEARQKRSSEAYRMALDNLMDIQDSKQRCLTRKVAPPERPNPQKLRKLYGTSRLSSICNIINKNTKSASVVRLSPARNPPPEDVISLVSSDDITENIDWEEVDRLINC